MNLEALFNAVIVKPIEQNEEMYGSIVVPDMGKDKNEHAIVISVGPGQHTHMGHFIPSEIKVGEEVVLPTQGFTKIEHNGEEYYVGPENQILARVKSTVADVLAETEVTEEEQAYINDIKLEENE
jgi:chaperonin GroES